MGSKIALLLGLSIAFVLLISSEVAARDLAKTTQKNLNRTPAAEGARLDGGGYHYEEVSGSRRELEGHGSLEGEKVGSNCSYFCQRIYSRCCTAAEAQALKNSAQVKPHD